MKKLLIFLSGILIGYMLVPQERASPLYVTAAHLPSTSLSGYTQLYANNTSDVAYYVDNNYTYKLPKVGSRVYMGKLSGRVSTILDNRTFSVTTDERVYRGLSGARVGLIHGKPFAFVSYLNPEEEVVCVSYE